jgi:AcrR family transcriptional regulator
MSPRTGRRPGQSGTREAILDAARASFTENGYDGATIRDVAKRARVDPALVHHYFDNKQKLFAAALDFPVNPAEVIKTIAEGDVNSWGERIARTFLQIWDTQTNRSPIFALIRSATSNDQAAGMLREFISKEIIGSITERLNVGRPELRATLVGSQLMGVAMARYIIAVEPLASLDGDELAGLIAPTLQRYLTGELGVPARPGPSESFP